ncbi:P-loop NTPase fold protein [Tistrella mobilis]|uniref:P-loop NTPase fold protein n=1 Tax=Tistrella mobilis TaxID=171437 RepID=UPI0035571083
MDDPGESVAPAPSMTVGALLKARRFRLSKNLRAHLGGMAPSPFETQQPVADIASYLSSAARHDNDWLAAIAGAGNRIVAWLTGVAARPVAISDLSLSAGLLAALEDAVDIRRRTGGKDTYIGARHLLMAILTAPDKDVQAELGRILQLTRGADDLAVWVTRCAERVFEAREPGEDLRIWMGLLSARGHPAAAERLQALVRDEALGNELPPEASEPEISETADMLPDAVPAGAIPRDAVPRLANDDGWGLVAEHRVGDDAVAAALARLAASESFTPPLAVGVFGAWGSGKSHFLRQVHDRVTELTAAKPAGFHHRIAQIRFNAWHYVDTDLWASLAGCIFEDLAAQGRGSAEGTQPDLLGRLATARRLTLEAAGALVVHRQAVDEAERARIAAEEGLRAERQQLRQALRPQIIAAAEGIRRAASGKEVGAAVESAFGEPLETIVDRWQEPRQAFQELKETLPPMAGLLRQLARPDQWLVLGGALAIAFLLPIVLGAAADWLRPLHDGLLVAVVGVTTVAARASRAMRQVLTARDALTRAAERFRAGWEVSLPPTAGDAAAEAARRRVAEAETRVAQATEDLHLALREQAEAARAFHDQTAAARLRAFLHDKAAADGVYRSRQGLIGTIRRDFADLSALMNVQASAEELRRFAEEKQAYEARLRAFLDGPGQRLTEDEKASLQPDLGRSPDPAFTRIILYIDDLDRCPPQQVVDVLQAVHLLLAFSLFVVIVAVDQRWLKGALVKVYPDLLDREGQAAAIDYLEKIFQLPVWPVQVRGDAASEFVRRRLAADLERPASVPMAAVSSALPASSIDDGPVSDPDDHDDDDRPAAVDDVPDDDISLEPLTLTQAEIDWLAEIAPLAASSPRRLLRLVNSYRLVRASLDAGTSHAVVTGEGFRPLGALLALAAADPVGFAALQGALQRSADAAALLHAVRETVPSLADALDELLKRHESVYRGLETWCAVVQRFSFADPTADLSLPVENHSRTQKTLNE